MKKTSGNPYMGGSPQKQNPYLASKTPNPFLAKNTPNYPPNTSNRPTSPRGGGETYTPTGGVPIFPKDPNYAPRSAYLDPNSSPRDPNYAPRSLATSPGTKTT